MHIFIITIYVFCSVSLSQVPGDTSIAENFILTGVGSNRILQMFIRNLAESIKLQECWPSA